MPGSAINGTGQIVNQDFPTVGLRPRSLVTSQIENQTQHVPKNAVRAIRVEAVLRAALVTVVITAPKSFAEIVLVFAHVHVVSVIAVGRIAKRVAVVRIESPVVLAIRLTGPKAFFIACIDCTSQQVRAVLIHVEVPVIAIIAITGLAIIVVSEALQTNLCLAQTLPIALLKTPLIQTSLLL